MFSEQEVPESVADLISALTYLYGYNLTRHFLMKIMKNDDFERFLRFFMKFES